MFNLNISFLLVFQQHSLVCEVLNGLNEPKLGQVAPQTSEQQHL